MIRFLLAFVLGAALAAGALTLRSFVAEAPDSVFASPEASQAARDLRAQLAPHIATLLTGDIKDSRAVLDEHFYGPRIEEARELYPVSETPLEIDGVYTEVFEPVGGIPAHNAGRVLINLHGGGFSMGARTEGRLESIPVAHLGRVKVISVDYRQGPEHRFPAASEDVATVYRHLLQDYEPEEIGIFGCSAGGMLTAQAVAWFAAEGLPQPGAIGIFCAGAGGMAEGDAAVITEAFGTQLGGDMTYFEGQDWKDPLISPLWHPELMAVFPPTLIIASTRDLALSSALATHHVLVEQDVDSELHVYEGLNHYFFADTGLPESVHAFRVMVDFFDRHLER